MTHRETGIEASAADKEIDEFVERTRELNGQEVRERESWNGLVTADAIRHFAWGTSDDNPLWIEPGYASESDYGSLVAPPTFVASVLYPVLHGAPMEVPLSSLIGELECSWLRPILEGDVLHAMAKQLGAFESRNRQGRRLVNILAEVTYRNQHDQIVAKARSTMVRVEQRATELLTDRTIHKYSDDELDVIKDALQHETRAGKGGIVSDQVEVGYCLGPLVRGPLTLGDMVCWQAAIGPSYRAGALGYRDCVDHPHTVALNPVTGWPVKYSQQHEDALLSQQRGMPAPFDNTVMRWAWVSPLLTNWMGDHGILKRLRISANEPILYGDANWYRGTVIKNVVKESGVALTVRITGTNQLGVVTTTGEAEVEIPHNAIRPAVKRDRSQRQPGDMQANTKFRPAHGLFERQATATPDAIALVADGERLTYAQLNKRVNQLAHYLGALGVRAGVSAGICVTRSADMVIGQLAILKAGGIYVPLDPDYPTLRLSQMIRDTSVSVLLLHQELSAILPATDAKTVCLDTEWERVTTHSGKNPDVEIDLDELAYVMYTSGSVGTPKAVAIRHVSLASYMDAMRKEIPIGTEDRYLYTASPCFSAAIRQTMLPLCSGAALYIANTDDRGDPRLLLERIQKDKATVWDTVPAIWRECVELLRAMSGPQRQSLLANKLRLVLVTGEPLMWDVPYAWAQEFQHSAAMINLYSQTETSGTVCICRIMERPAEQDGIVPLGHSVGGVEVHLLDENLCPVESGEIGELCVAGDRIAKGYLNDSHLTLQKFKHLALSPGVQTTLYRTGDLACCHSDGTLLFCGRRDNQVKLRGFRIQLGEIESVLRKHAAIQQAIVVMQTDETGDERLVAYVVTRNCPLPEVEQLRAFLKERLPDYMIPAGFVELTELPLTPSGKPDRMVLSEMRQNRPQLANRYVAPQTPIEQELAQIWEDVLGVGRIGIHDDFFALGGHSLSASRVISRINETFAVDFRVRHLLESPSIEGMALIVAEVLIEYVEDNGVTDWSGDAKGATKD